MRIRSSWVVENPDGSTQIKKVGNVILSVPDLDGTGIDPTLPFTTFVVTNTNDSGPGSLRAAIEAANAFTGEGLAVITFDVPETDPSYLDIDSNLTTGDADPDVFVITPESALPALTRGSIVINGQTQAKRHRRHESIGPQRSC